MDFSRCWSIFWRPPHQRHPRLLGEALDAEVYPHPHVPGDPSLPGEQLLALVIRLCSAGQLAIDGIEPSKPQPQGATGLKCLRGLAHPLAES